MAKHHSMKFEAALERAEQGLELSVDDAEALLSVPERDIERLLHVASTIRDAGARQRGDHTGRRITYSRKVFIPLTTLCRDRCHYCVFVDTPGELRAKDKAPYMSAEEVLQVARQGAAMGCKEALFTLGDRPEDRWSVAADWLAANGYESTLDYVRHMGEIVLSETGLLPHFNPGVMSWAELQRLRPLAPSMGMMLETTSERLWATPGQPHFASPDKDPKLRLQVLDDAGRARIPFTTGILLGIGETIRERAESIIAIRDSHRKWGHIQETIVQNFRSKPRTAMQNRPDLEHNEYIIGVAVTRIVMGPASHIQAPPNLTQPEELHSLIRAGIDDWGGISPLTPDHVNPERPWPQIDRLAELTAQSGYQLEERLTAHPRWTAEQDYWLDSNLHQSVRELEQTPAPAVLTDSQRQVLRRAEQTPNKLSDADYATMLTFRGVALDKLTELADQVRHAQLGDRLTYVVNRNVDATQFDPELRHDGVDESALRDIASHAHQGGASEICVQGMLDPALPGESYFELIEALHSSADLHIHAYRVSEALDASQRLGISVAEFYKELRARGVKSVPGTGARILDDDIRSTLSAGQDLPVEQWLSILRSAHQAGLTSTATMNYGHIEAPHEVVMHLNKLIALQQETGGFTEFIPMPVIPQDHPVPLRNVRRMADDAYSRAIYAVSRLKLTGHIDHIQAAWPKFGLGTARDVLQAGADDLGGLLLEGPQPKADPETGRTISVTDVHRLAEQLDRRAVKRTTSYQLLGTPDPIAR